MSRPTIFEKPVAFAELVLPDGRLAVQRRTADAPTSPNKLQFFGGHVEYWETMMQAAMRELSEETDLPVTDMEFEYVDNLLVSKGKGRVREVGLVRSRIPDADFNDYEGQGRPEVWTAEALLESGQLVTSVDYILRLTARIA